MALGKVAYEKWCELVIHPPTWPWDALPATAKEGWEAIAQAVITEDARQASEIAHTNGTQDCHSCD